jgi:hypothetical protein
MDFLINLKNVGEVCLLRNETDTPIGLVDTKTNAKLFIKPHNTLFVILGRMEIDVDGADQQTGKDASAVSITYNYFYGSSLKPAAKRAAKQIGIDINEEESAWFERMHNVLFKSNIAIYDVKSRIVISTPKYVVRRSGENPEESGVDFHQQRLFVLLRSTN